MLNTHDDLSKSSTTLLFCIGNSVGRSNRLPVPFSPLLSHPLYSRAPLPHVN